MSINPLIARVFMILLVFALLLIPLSMVRGVITERTNYRAEAARSIAEQWSGEQLVAGPVLALRYRRNVEQRVWDKEARRYVTETSIEYDTAFAVPDSLDVAMNAAAEERAYGIHAVPVYTSDTTLTAAFSTAALETLAATLDDFVSWERAELVLAVSDPRGLAATPAIAIDGEALVVAPGSEIDAGVSTVSGVVALAKLSSDMHATATLRLRGSTSLGVVPFGREGRYRLASSWPHPGFHGRFLPAERTITAAGFDAVWEVSAFASRAASLLSECGSLSCSALAHESFAVRFTNPVDIYVQSDRATKYAVLTILVAFVAFFLLETLAGRSLHFVNYALVGAALVVFYLLLLSLAEHIGFGAAYALATLACAGLASYYLAPSLGRPLATGYGVAECALNSVLYGILKSEDHALMAGSLLVFAVLATVMVATRNVDWRTFRQR